MLFDFVMLCGIVYTDDGFVGLVLVWCAHTDEGPRPSGLIHLFSALPVAVVIHVVYFVCKLFAVHRSLGGRSGTQNKKKQKSAHNNNKENK